MRAFLWLPLVACGGDPILPVEEDTDPPAEDTFTPDTDPVDTDLVDTDPPVGCEPQDERLITEACEHSINRALIGESSGALRLATQSGPAEEPEPINGGGFGNRAIAGFPDLHNTALADLGDVVVDMRRVSGTNIRPRLELQVDTTCDGGAWRLVIVRLDELDGVDIGDSFFRYSFSGSDAVWLADVNVPVIEGSGLLLSDADANTNPDNPNPRVGRSLASFLDAYPDACVRNGESGRKGLPVEQSVSGVLFTLAPANNTASHAWNIRRLSLADRHYLRDGDTLETDTDAGDTDAI